MKTYLKAALRTIFASIQIESTFEQLQHIQSQITMKSNLVFAMALAFVCVSHVTMEDPGIVVRSTLGVKVLTVPFLDRINHMLMDQNVYGRHIRLRGSDDCMDTEWDAERNDFTPKPAVCDMNKFSQSIRVKDKTWTVGQHLADQKSWPCMACKNYAENCLLEFVPCTFEGNMRFFARVHPSQIDLSEERVYFSIHSTLYPKRCLSMT